MKIQLYIAFLSTVNCMSYVYAADSVYPDVINSDSLLNTVNNDKINQYTNSEFGSLFGNTAFLNAGYIKKFNNSGVFSGNFYGMDNSGVIDVVNNYNSIFSSGTAINNSGAISAINNLGASASQQIWAQEKAIYNSGLINLISNSATSTLNSSGLAIDNDGTINSFVNNGAMYAATSTFNNSGVVNEIKNSGAITGDSSVITNSKTIQNIENTGALNSSDITIKNKSDAVISDLVNNGSIYGKSQAINNNGEIYSINNQAVGTISSEGISGNSTITNGTSGYIGGVYNSGTIFGYDAAINNQGVINDIISNYGTLTSTVAAINNSGSINVIENYGTIEGATAVNNTGTITNGINNHSVLNGNVNLGGATLNLLSSLYNSPVVNGYISGIAGSTINIGSDSINTYFTSNGDALVDNVIVHTGSQLVLNGSQSWSANNSFINNGLISVSGNGSSGSASINVADKFTNAGTISVTDNRLSIQGDYHGEEANLILGFNSSDTTDGLQQPKLVIHGNASGTTYLSLYGLGSVDSLEGIQLISTDSSSSSAFVQRERISAGAYDYLLQQRDNGTSWVLSSLSSAGTHIIRPESASYANNLRSANNLFNMSLGDRQDDSQYYIDQAGKKIKSSLWLRTSGGHVKSNMSDSENKSTSNDYVIQLGSTLIKWSNNGKDIVNVGALFGYGNSKSKTHNEYSKYTSNGKVDGYSIGSYGTWYSDSASKAGLYVDTWLLYNWFNNEINSDNFNKTYKSNGVTASAETGYNVSVFRNDTSDSLLKEVWLQPQVQLTWMGVKSDSFKDDALTNFKQGGNNNIESRVGFKASVALDYTKHSVKPFVETNWIHNTKSFGVKMNGVENTIGGTDNIGELKTGVEGKANDKVNLWANVSQQIGQNSYSELRGVIGVKAIF